MSEEAIQDTGSQEVAAAAAAPVSFLDSLPEDLRSNPSLRNFPDAATLAKSYVHAQRMIGADKIPLPGKHATPDEWRAVYRKLGAPDDAKNYELQGDLAFEDGALETFKQRAFEAGLTNAQANELARFYSDQATSSKDNYALEMERVREEGIQQLQREYGKAFDQKLALAQSAARTFLGGTELFDNIELSDGRMLGDHPEIIKMFASLGEQIGEDKLVGEPTEMVMTPQEAQRKISELTSTSTPYWDKMHSEHDNYIAEVLRLREYL